MFRISPLWLSLRCLAPSFCLSLLIGFSATTAVYSQRSSHSNPAKTYDTPRHTSTHQAPVAPISPEKSQALVTADRPHSAFLSPSLRLSGPPPYTDMVYSLSLPSSLFQNVIYSLRPSLNTLFKIATSCPHRATPFPDILISIVLLFYIMCSLSCLH